MALAYAVIKRTDCVMAGAQLQNLISYLNVLLLSSADCERGFSQMNLYHTSGRNRLLVTSVDDMLVVGINGPNLAMWTAEKYVLSWLKTGRHVVLIKATGLPKKFENARHFSK